VPKAPERKTIASANAANATMDWLTAGALALFGGWLYWSFRADLTWDVHDRHFNPIIFFPALLILIGLRFAVKAALGSLRLRKYGTSWLDADPLVPGKTFSAVLRTTRDLEPPVTFGFCVRCIETAATGKRRQSIRWEHTAHVPADGLRSSQGIPVTIDLPADVPRTTDPPGGPSTPGIRWVMIVRAPRPGLNYEGTFGLRAGRTGEE
jgi:hypothetical protein